MVEEQDSLCSRLIKLESAITVYIYIHKSNPSHTWLKQKQEKNLRITFTSPSKPALGRRKIKGQITISMAIAKLFALHENSKNHTSICTIKNRIEKLNNKTFSFDFTSSEEATKELINQAKKSLCRDC